MSARKHTEVLAQIATWNASNPVGTPVVLRDDSDVPMHTVTRSIAWGLGGTNEPHTAVVKVVGKAGGWELDRITRDTDATAGKYVPVWRAVDTTYQELKVDDTRSITLVPRPSYCNRGRFLAQIHGFVVSDTDYWPRYYFDEARAKAEIDDWLQLNLDKRIGVATAPYAHEIKPLRRRPRK